MSSFSPQHSTAERRGSVKSSAVMPSIGAPFAPEAGPDRGKKPVQSETRRAAAPQQNAEVKFHTDPKTGRNILRVNIRPANKRKGDKTDHISPTKGKTDMWQLRVKHYYLYQNISVNNFIYFVMCC